MSYIPKKGDLVRIIELHPKDVYFECKGDESPIGKIGTVLEPPDVWTDDLEGYVGASIRFEDACLFEDGEWYAETSLLAARFQKVTIYN